MSRFSGKARILGITFPLIFVSDLITKEIVLARFQLGESVPVIPGLFDFTYVRNPGAAFGFLAGADPSFRVPFFYVLTTVAISLMGYLFYQLPKASRWGASGLSLVMSGAVGNLLDRIRHGYVVDFLDFHWRHQAHFPAFNIADSAISVGVAILLVDSFFIREEEKLKTV